MAAHPEAEIKRLFFALLAAATHKAIGYY